MYALIVLFIFLYVVYYSWRLLVRLALRVVSRLNSKYTISLNSEGVVRVRFAHIKGPMEGVVCVEIALPSFTWTPTWGVRIASVSVTFSLVKVKARVDLHPPPAPKVWTKPELPWLIRIIPIPKVSIARADLIVDFPNPPQVPTPADATGGQPWSAFIRMTGTTANFDSETDTIAFKTGSLVGLCQLLGRDQSEKKKEKFEWLNLEAVSVAVPLNSSGQDELNHDTCTISTGHIHLGLNIEAFFAILPTVAPLIQVPDGRPPRPPRDKPPTIPFGISIPHIDSVSFVISSKTAGTCSIVIPKISAAVSDQLISSVIAGGCLVTRTSPLHGTGDVMRIPAFGMSGTHDALTFTIPSIHITSSPDGMVYWMRALVMTATKFSICKRPARVNIRNLRTKVYYDYEMCGIDPPDWDDIPNFIPKIVPIRIVLAVTSAIEIRTETGERILTEDAVVDCNLPKMEISFSANSVEVFGASKRRCALIRNFSGWVPQFSGMCLKNTSLEGIIGTPPDDVRCHHAAPSPLGPIPIALRFADVSVEIAEDLIMLIGQQIIQAVDSVRRWDVEPGYNIVPAYKPVTIRLSRVRFAPAELAPAVLDVNDWELAIGPTKDCLNFAFLGVKAWVPSTVTIPPILHVAEPALVSIRVRRLLPLAAVTTASDYSLLPGSWRDLRLDVPMVKAAVAPGLHATTRFIDTVMKTFRKSITPPPGPTRPETPMHLRKGPVKNVWVRSRGGEVLVVKNGNGADGVVRARTTEDIPNMAYPMEVLAAAKFGDMDLSIWDFTAGVNLHLSYLSVSVPNLLHVSVSEIKVDSSDGSVYTCDISRTPCEPVLVRLTDNAMAMFGAYSAIRDCFTKAWYVAPLPKLTTVMTHMVESNELIRAQSGSRRGSPRHATPPNTSLVNGKLEFNFPMGLDLSWAVPNSAACLTVSLPPNRLSGECVFHGFALRGGIGRLLPELTDEVLIQWLRYPWTVSLGGDGSPKSPTLSSERESWDLHGMMTTRISEYLSRAGPGGVYEYASARGLIDTPVYLQTLVSLSEVEIAMRVGDRKQRLAGIDRLEIRAHCHNLPTVAGSVVTPKLKVSYWTSCVQDTSGGLTLDLIPEVHIPILLTLVGSPADADPNSSVIHGLAGRDDSTVSGDAADAPSLLDKILDHIDLGFRVTILGITGRASGWCFAASRISLIKEEDKGKGLIVVEVRDVQVAMAGSGESGRQPEHSRACLGVPSWTPSSPDEEVMPFIAVRQMMIHVGLDQPDAAVTGSPRTVFCNIQGGRVWWSPSLNRGMRLSLTRTDALVEMLGRWRTRFTQELFARLGKSVRKKKTFESIMKMLDLFIPTGGAVKLVLRCADTQVNFHCLLNGLDDSTTGYDPGPLAPSSTTRSMITSPLLSPNAKGPDIPKHFYPFRDTAVTSPPPAPPSRSGSCTPELRETCDCVKPMSDSQVRWLNHAMAHDIYSLELPRILSWWTRSAHLQNCALPPLPLPVYFAPPNSRKERAVGAIKYNQWVSESAPIRTAPVSPAPTGFGAPPPNVRPKPRGSQLVLNSTESIFEIIFQRTIKAANASSLHVTFNAAFNTIQGSVAPTALRGLVWLGQNGQTILRQILQIQKISIIVTSELFPLKSARVQLLIPKVLLSADDDAFHIIADVLRNCILYRGALIGPASLSSDRPVLLRSKSAPPTPPSQPAAHVRFEGPIPNSKRDAIVDGLLTSLAVADATLPPANDHLSLEYVIESISVNLTHRQRCFVQLQLTGAVGKHSFSIGHPHRPMLFSFQLKEVQILSSDGDRGNRMVLQGGGNVLTVRGNDRYITLNNREWHVYDTLFLSTSPIVVDVTQDLIEELYAFIFPPSAADAQSSSASAGLHPSGSLESVDEQVEVTGNRLLTGRNKVRHRTSVGSLPSVIDPQPRRPESSPAAPASSAAMPVFFKFVRIGNIDSIITFKGKQFALNHMSLTLKYYLKRRRLATWKEFLDEWGAKVGKQAFGSFVKHGFSRRKGLQDLIKFGNGGVTSSSDVDRLLFGKYGSGK